MRQWGTPVRRYYYLDFFCLGLETFGDIDTYDVRLFHMCQNVKSTGFFPFYNVLIKIQQFVWNNV